MNTETLIELFGYIGSALVVISMLMSSIVKLRVINVIGSVISATYALIVHAIPLVVMNICLIIINLVSLRKLLKNTKTYQLVETTTADSLVQYFLTYHQQDIEQVFPDFNRASLQNKPCYVVFCEGNAAGVTIVQENQEQLEVLVDYSTQAYRDCSVGKFLYQKLTEMGKKSLLFRSTLTPTHQSYLLKMGFIQEEDGYRKTLS